MLDTVLARRSIRSLRSHIDQRWLLHLFATKRVLLKRTTVEITFHSEWQAFHDAYVREAASPMTKEMAVGFVKGSGITRSSFSPRPIPRRCEGSWPGWPEFCGSPLVRWQRKDWTSFPKTGPI
jgi:hypothetical protein